MQYYYLKSFPEKSLWADIKFFLSSRAFYLLTIYGYTFSLKQKYTFPNLYIFFVFEMKQTLIATWIVVGKDIWLIFNHLDTDYSIRISYISGMTNSKPHLYYAFFIIMPQEQQSCFLSIFFKIMFLFSVTMYDVIWREDKSLWSIGHYDCRDFPSQGKPLIPTNTFRCGI